MKLIPGLKIREMAGEWVVIIQGRNVSDMTKVISLNTTSKYLWESVSDKDFDENFLVNALMERYKVDEDVAREDVKNWIEKLRKAGVVEE